MLEPQDIGVEYTKPQTEKSEAYEAWIVWGKHHQHLGHPENVLCISKGGCVILSIRISEPRMDPGWTPHLPGQSELNEAAEHWRAPLTQVTQGLGCPRYGRITGGSQQDQLTATDWPLRRQKAKIFGRCIGIIELKKLIWSSYIIVIIIIIIHNTKRTHMNMLIIIIFVLSKFKCWPIELHRLIDLLMKVFMTAKNGVGFKSRKWLANQFGGLYKPKNVCIDYSILYIITY